MITSTTIWYRTLIEHWDGTTWSVVSSPNVGNSSALHVIAVEAPDDVWAVGSYYIRSMFQTLTEHWDGTTWSVVSSPNVGNQSNYLGAVSIVGPADVWAVGSYNNGDQTLIEHWDGTTWSVVSSPNVAGSHNTLGDIAVVAPGDVWAVGNHYLDLSIGQTLTEHWGIGDCSQHTNAYSYSMRYFF